MTVFTAPPDTFTATCTSPERLWQLAPSGLVHAHRPLPSRSVDRGQFTFSSRPSLLVCREQNGVFADLISWGSPDCSSLCWITAILHNVFKLGPGKQRECDEPLNTLRRDYLFSAEGINNGAKGGLVQWNSFYLLEDTACNPPPKILAWCIILCTVLVWKH